MAFGFIANVANECKFLKLKTNYEKTSKNNSFFAKVQESSQTEMCLWYESLKSVKNAQLCEV